MEQWDFLLLFSNLIMNYNKHSINKSMDLNSTNKVSMQRLQDTVNNKQISNIDKIQLNDFQKSVLIRIFLNKL